MDNAVRTIYFDNAATSYPMPGAVRDSVAECIEKFGGNPGRGMHRLSADAAEIVYKCRCELADMFGAVPENIVFTQNTTYALNTAIFGVAKQGCHFVCSDMEHNSVWRPLSELKSRGVSNFSIFGTGADKSLPPVRIAARVCASANRSTTAVVCTHASNICSYTLPIAEIGRVCRDRRYTFIVDAAQSAGHIPINIRDMNIDILCIPGHKGLLGPTGVGAVIFNENFPCDRIKPLVFGGSGVNSLQPAMPDELPERLEAGTLPVAAIAGLCAGIKEVRRIGLKYISDSESFLFTYIRDRLLSIPRVTVYRPDCVGSVLLFNISGIPSDRVAELLGGSGICVRAGLHCAPLAHKTLMTPDTGAVRVSFGPYNTQSDAAALVAAVRSIVRRA